MKYTGNTCPGCGEAFKDDDDIVVCPDCGTPQHRSCYEKQDKCVVSESHGENYVWQGVANKTNDEKPEKRETIPCPNCGNLNPKGSEQCATCGMKFTLFGKNIVDSIYEAEKKEGKPSSDSDIPDYKPPFTLGEGKAFEHSEEKEELPELAQNITEKISEAITGETRSTDGRIILPGPFPAGDEIGGVKTNTVGNLVGMNAMGYIGKFKKLQEGKKISFNFASFIFTPYWFFYRRLYNIGAFFMAAFLALSIIFTPATVKYFDAFEAFAKQYVAVNPNATKYEAMLMFNPDPEIAAPLLIFLALTVIFKLISGFIANPLYKNYILKNAKELEYSHSRQDALVILKKAGNVSFFATLLSVFAEQVLTYIISAFM